MAIDVKLQVFEGPLDLLLHLIEKNQVNIYDIPIVTITEQYMDYLEQMQSQDLDVMSEFLVMAATLLQIKARWLLPKEEKEEEEEEDPRAELVQRLLEYKMYKYAAMELKDMELDASYALYRQPHIPEEVQEKKEDVDPAELCDGLTLRRLNEIFQMVMKRQADKIDPIRSKFGTIEKEEVSIEDKMDSIREELRGLRGISFRTLLDMQASKTEVIVTFLAVLELIKTGSIAVRQEHLFDDIVMDSLE